MPYGSERENVRHAGDADGMGKYKLVYDNGSEPGGSASINDLETAERLAKELSGYGEGARVGVYLRDNGVASKGAGWTDPLAVFENGKRYPAHWVLFASGTNQEDIDSVSGAQSPTGGIRSDTSAIIA